MVPSETSIGTLGPDHFTYLDRSCERQPQQLSVLKDLSLVYG